MFYLNKETELTKQLLEKMINRYRVEVEPKLNKYKRYYDEIIVEIGDKKLIPLFINQFLKDIISTLCKVLLMKIFPIYIVKFL